MLRFTEWKNYPSPVLVVSERSFHTERLKHRSIGKSISLGAPTFETQGVLAERGRIYGEMLVRIRPILRQILQIVTDDAGIPLELSAYAAPAANRFRGNLPLDEEAGAKLALIFKLTDRVKDMERVELIARRINRFTREEATYWLSRIVHFGPEAGRWSVAGMRIMLAGEPGDRAIPEILETLQLS